MRILFSSSPAAGHLLPLLPLARAADRAGHDVLIACGASLTGIVQRAGFRHVSTGPPSLVEVIGRVAEAGRPSPDRALVIYREVFAGIVAAEMADGVLELAADWPPDIIVHEDMEMGSWVSAESLGIPHVVVQAAAWRPAKRGAVVEIQNELRVRHGLAADPNLAGRDGAVYFTTRPAAMRDAGASPPVVLRELRPEADDRAGSETAELPAWLAKAPERPRAVVTLGTVNADRVDLLRPIVEGLAGLDLEVVVALGAEPATLGVVPARVRVERYVPMSDVLPRSTFIVHHGGSGTMLAALAAGRPMVMVPIAADQPDNTALCLAAGVAVALDPGSVSPAAVQAAATHLLDEPTFADRAQAIAAEIAAMPDADAALTEIEGLV